MPPLPSSTSIPGLPTGLALTGDTVFAGVQDGVDKKFTISQITAFSNSSAQVALNFQAPLLQTGSTVTLNNFFVGSDNGVVYRASGTAIGITPPGLIGQLLLGNGIASPPSWLAATTATGSLLAGTNGASPIWIPPGTTGQVLTGITGGNPVWSSTIPAGAGVTSFSAGSTGLTPNTATVGAILLGGVLVAGFGGTGVTAATGTGPNNVLSTQPSILSATLTTPAIGVATGTSLSLTGGETTFSGTAPPVGGTVGTGVRFSSTPNFGLFFGSGAPTLSAAQGSLFENSAATVSSAVYYNTSGGNTWNTLLATGGPLGTPSSGNLVNTSGYSAAAVVGLVNQGILGPTTQSLVSGSVSPYATPAGAKWLKVRYTGGGGGGGGAGATTAPSGSAGTVTIFNGITAAAGLGGTGSAAALNPGGGGGTGGAGTATVRFPGNAGGTSGPNVTGLAQGVPGFGAASIFGGSGIVTSAAAANGSPGGTNTGAGGGGASGLQSSTSDAGGGGSGEYVELIVTNPAATIPFTIGLGGAGGIGTGTNAATGGRGANAVILVEEHYNYG